MHEEATASLEEEDVSFLTRPLPSTTPPPHPVFVILALSGSLFKNIFQTSPIRTGGKAGSTA